MLKKVVLCASDEMLHSFLIISAELFCFCFFPALHVFILLSNLNEPVRRFNVILEKQSNSSIVYFNKAPVGGRRTMSGQKQE